MPRHISQENLSISTEFTKILSNLLEFVDTISQHIPEGKYLEIMNNLKFLNDNKPCENPMEVLNMISVQIENDPVVNLHRQRVEYTVEDIRQTNRKKEVCPICDTVVRNLSKHKKTLKCLTIAETKKLSAWSKLEHTNHIKVLMGTLININNKIYKYYLENSIYNFKINSNYNFQEELF